jgi:hypothetical protein
MEMDKQVHLVVVAGLMVVWAVMAIFHFLVLLKVMLGVMGVLILVASLLQVVVEVPELLALMESVAHQPQY